jgi:hypothetical protein
VKRLARPPDEGDLALQAAKDWLAEEMTEDFKRHATDRETWERLNALAEDHSAYDGHGRGWEGWFVSPPSLNSPTGSLFHYRLTPCDGGCDVPKEES